MSDLDKPDLFVVRLYDGMDGLWMEVSEPLPRAEAERIYAEKTENGTKMTTYDHIDYYRIFPANTRMLYSEQAGFDPDTGTWKGGGG